MTLLRSLLCASVLLAACGAPAPRTDVPALEPSSATGSDSEPTGVVRGAEASARDAAGATEASAEALPDGLAPSNPVDAEAAAPVRSVEDLLAEVHLLERADDYTRAILLYDELLATHAAFEEREEALQRRATLLAFVDLAERSYARALAAESVQEEIQYLALIQSFWPGYEDVGLRLRAARSGRNAPQRAVGKDAAPPQDG